MMSTKRAPCIRMATPNAMATTAALEPQATQARLQAAANLAHSSASTIRRSPAMSVSPRMRWRTVPWRSITKVMGRPVTP